MESGSATPDGCLPADIRLLSESGGSRGSEHAAMGEGQAERLPQLTGARVLAALWIVCHHVEPREKGSAFTPFVTRVDVAVEYFVLLSGFLSQHIYGYREPPRGASALAKLYVRRLARILLTAQVATLASIFLLWCGHFEVASWRTLACLFFVQGWAEPAPSCPNMPTWYVDALLPSWLLYPLVTQPALAAASTLPLPVFLALGVGLWLAAAGPSLALMAFSSSWLSWRQVTFTWFWPPAQLADFALGAFVAAAVRRMPPPRAAGILADVAITGLLLACFFAPLPEKPEGWDGPAQWRPGHYMCWEQLTGRGSAPLLAAFLYGCCGRGGKSSCAASVLSHKALVALGSYTLEVYLFQAPLRSAFIWIAPPFKKATWLWPGFEWGPDVFFAYLLLLWLLSGLFAELVAQPLQRRLVAALEGAPRAAVCARRGAAERKLGRPRGAVAAESELLRGSSEEA